MFILRTSFIYAFSKKKGQRAISIMIMLGLAIGLVALLVISAVMNGLQDAQLKQLRNIESFDLIVKSQSLSLDDIKSIEGVDDAFFMLQSNVLVVDKTTNKSTSARVRAYSNDALDSKRMKESLYFLTSSSKQKDGMIISYSIMNALKLSKSDNISVTFLKKGKTATVVPSSQSLGVDAVYTSNLQEFNASTVFMDYEVLSSILGKEDTQIAVYANGSQKSIVSAILEKDKDAKITTWQEYNKALYSALMLEKTLMYVFLAFMFLIICVNLKNSTKRLLRNKQKEGAMLRALGLTKKKVYRIFLLQGLLVCLLGEVLGIVLGKLVISNLQSILGFADSIIMSITGNRTVLSVLPINASISNLEILMVCAFIFTLSYLFTIMGLRKIHKSEIMEVILHASY